MSLAAPGDLDGRERFAVEAELRSLADDEFVHAERYVEWQVRGPTLEADISVANVAQDEYGHARLWYDLLEDLGYDETELLWEREPADFRHATLVEQPYERGDWADPVVRGYLYDVFELLRLEALAESAYPPLADRVPKVRREESYHREHAQNWLERLVEDDEGRERVQAALDRLYPHALTLSAPTDEEDAIVDLGLRDRSLAELREEWLAVTTPYLEGLGLDVPDPALPEARGRDGTHTDAWRSLYDEFTYTYELLDRKEAPKLMVDPDDA